MNDVRPRRVRVGFVVFSVAVALTVVVAGWFPVTHAPTPSTPHPHALIGLIEIGVVVLCAIGGWTLGATVLGRLLGVVFGLLVGLAAALVDGRTGAVVRQSPTTPAPTLRHEALIIALIIVVVVTLCAIGGWATSDTTGQGRLLGVNFGLSVGLAAAFIVVIAVVGWFPTTSSLPSSPYRHALLIGGLIGIVLAGLCAIGGWVLGGTTVLGRLLGVVFGLSVGFAAAAIVARVARGAPGRSPASILPAHPHALIGLIVIVVVTVCATGGWVLGNTSGLAGLAGVVVGLCGGLAVGEILLLSLTERVVALALIAPIILGGGLLGAALRGRVGHWTTERSRIRRGGPGRLPGAVLGGGAAFLACGVILHLLPYWAW
jgi:heme A synthase